MSAARPLYLLAESLAGPPQPRSSAPAAPRAHLAPAVPASWQPERWRGWAEAAAVSEPARTQGGEPRQPRRWRPHLPAGLHLVHH